MLALVVTTWGADRDAARALIERGVRVIVVNGHVEGAYGEIWVDVMMLSRCPEIFDRVGWPDLVLVSDDALLPVINDLYSHKRASHERSSSGG